MKYIYKLFTRLAEWWQGVVETEPPHIQLVHLLVNLNIFGNAGTRIKIAVMCKSSIKLFLIFYPSIFKKIIKLTLVLLSRNNQHYAQICTTALFYILAPTCFGSSLPLSGGFLDPSELNENTDLLRLIMHGTNSKLN
jgi:hypothetical protein